MWTCEATRHLDFGHVNHEEKKIPLISDAILPHTHSLIENTYLNIIDRYVQIDDQMWFQQLLQRIVAYLM